MNGSNFNLFENFTLEYDQMIPWETRLKREKPFFEQVFGEHQVKRVLDLACGTGKHAIMFNLGGWETVGLDQSEAMVRRAEENAGEAGASVTFRQGDFLGFPAALSDQKTFDALLVLGNSLPHLLNHQDLDRTLENIYHTLGDRGILVLQNRNYDKILTQKIRFMPPNSWEQEGEEKIFFRFIDFADQGITFNIVTFTRMEKGWDFEVQANKLWPMQAGEVLGALAKAGFRDIKTYGDFAFQPFEPENSADLVIVAKK